MARFDSPANRERVLRRRIERRAGVIDGRRRCAAAYEKKDEEAHKEAPKAGAADLGTTGFTTAMSEFKRAMQGDSNIAAKQLKEAEEQTKAQKELVALANKPKAIPLNVASIIK